MSKNCVIAIPSKNRPDYTAGKFFSDYTLFIEPQDKKKYSFFKGEKRVLKENDKGFGFVLNEILDYTLEKDCKYFLFVDDDIYGIKRRDKSDFKEKEFLEEGINIMESRKLSQLWISFAGHNWYEKGEIKDGGAVWGMHISNAEHIKRMGGYLNSLILFNDYEITARLVSKGYKVAGWYKYMFQHKMKSKKGGAEMFYKKRNLVLSQCLYLKERYGDAVRVFENESHNMLPEVRFNWRKLKKRQSIA
jgi:hypothetical protein